MPTRKPIDNTPSEHTVVIVPATNASLRHRPWFLAFVLVIATFLAYQSVWRAGFIWDDDHHLTDNPAMTAPHGLQMIWSSLAISRYYPLTLTTFWFQRRLWGLNPMPYHLVTIALHALNGVLVYLVLRRLRVPAAWLAAMLWTLHPVNVESVAWITELKNTQSGCFFFLAVLCFLRSEEGAARRWYALALLCGAAALLSKPSTVILPLALLLCVWWQRRRWRWLEMLRIAPFVGMAVAMSALTVIEQRGQILRAGTGEWKLVTADRLVIASKAVLFYASKLLWPVPLMFVYPRWNLETGSFLSWLPWLGLVAAGIVLWFWRREPWARAGMFGGGFFVVALLPVLGFFNVFYFRYSFVADHFQYLASVGLIALAASGAAMTCERIGPRARCLGTAGAALTLIALAALTWKQGRIYRNMEGLWRDTLAKNPRCWMAHTNLGNLYQISGRISEAREQYEEALRIKPDYDMAHNNLAVTLIAAGQPDEAIRELELALRIKPDLVEAEDNLAWLLATLPPAEGGDPTRAVELAQRSCALTGNRAAANLNTLAVAYAAAGRFDDAVAAAQKALDLARSAGQRKLIGEIEAQLELYRGGRATPSSTDMIAPSRP